MKTKKRVGPKIVEGGVRGRKTFSLNEFESSQIDTVMKDLKTDSRSETIRELVARHIAGRCE